MPGLLLWSGACSGADSTPASTADAGQELGQDGGGEDGGDPAPRCYARVVGVPATLAAPESGSPHPTFVRSATGVVGVAAGPGARGYHLFQLAWDGQLRGPGRTLWPEEQPAAVLRLAVSGDVLAIVEQVGEEASRRSICRLSMVRPEDAAAIRPPSRISDPPDPETVQNEVAACDMTAVDEGFVVVWHQVTSNRADQSSLFVQHFDRAGMAQGNRLTLATGDKRLGQFSVTSAGARAVVLFAATREAQPQLAFLERGAVSTTPLDARVAGNSGFVTLAPAHDGFFATAGNVLFALDRDGRLTSGPFDLDPPALVAPLDEGYVAVSHEEYLVARTLDAELRFRSEPTALSDDRSAHGEQFVYAPDGSNVALIYRDAGRLRLARLACSAEPPPVPGPRPCPVEAEVAPLEDGCFEPVCHTIVRLDYLTLGLRGWTVSGGAASPVDRAAAAAAARVVFEEHDDDLSSGTTVSGPAAGLFTAFVTPSDFGAFALVGEASGLVVAAGGVVWSGTGRYWIPTGWNDPGDLVCAAAGVEPTTSYLDPGGCAGDEEGGRAATAQEALDVVLRSNLATHVASQGPFSAFTYLYTPTVGGCSPQQAEYLVVLTRREQ